MLEATLEAEIDGEKVPFRMLRPTLGNEPDRDKRREIDRIRTTMTEEHLNPVYLDAVRVHRPGPRGPRRAELHRALPTASATSSQELADQCRALLESTERLYEESADRLFRDRVGVGLDEARALGRPARLPRARSGIRSSRRTGCCPALEATLADLGIDLRSQENVHLDIEQRPNKTPRAFCAPIEVPGQGHARDPADGRRGRLARALPRGRPHRALRAHLARPLRRGAPARRQRGHRGLGDAAPVAHRRPDLAEPPARLPAAAGVRRRGRDAASSTSSGATARSSCTSSSSSPWTTSSRRGSTAATWRSSATRSRSSRARRTTSATSTRAST